VTRAELKRGFPNATEEFLRKNSECRVASVESRKLRVTNSECRVKVPNSKFEIRQSKLRFRAGWRVIGGVRKFYRSRWEANYARYLAWQQRQGLIVAWVHEPETFWFAGVRRGCVSYLPDFKVTLPSGAVEFHEVKGHMDAKSKTKLRRMAKYHPTIKIKVFDSSWYKRNVGKLRMLCPGWE
jgi:hypothetical protein